MQELLWCRGDVWHLMSVVRYCWVWLVYCRCDDDEKRVWKRAGLGELGRVLQGCGLRPGFSGGRRFAFVCRFMIFVSGQACFLPAKSLICFADIYVLILSQFSNFIGCSQREQSISYFIEWNNFENAGFVHSVMNYFRIGLTRCTSRRCGNSHLPVQEKSLLWLFPDWVHCILLSGIFGFVNRVISTRIFANRLF